MSNLNPTSMSARSSSNALNRLLAAGNVALIAVTWPLWTPQTVFPQIPLFSIAGKLPLSIEWGLVGLLLLSLSVVFLATRTFRRYASLMVGLSALALVCIDQHRLQPWAWQFVIVSFVLAVAKSAIAVAVWRWLVIGIYAWSAWSKLDYGFCVQHGPFLLDGLCQSIGFTNGTRNWPEIVRFVVSGSIPIFELSVASGLCWLRTRRFALVGSMMMHIGLLLALGPLGHRHQPGVLVWNVFFLVQNWLLFRGERWFSGSIESNVTSIGAAGEAVTEDVKTESTDQNRSHSSSQSDSIVSGDVDSIRINRGDQIGMKALRHRECTCCFGDHLSWFVVIAALLWPLLEPFGLCDHWPAWAVYAAKPERVIVFLEESELSKLPENMKRYLGPQSVLDEWYPVRIDRWSLDSLHVPIYPQDRFQIGVALGLVRRFHLTRVRVVVEGPANRWSGSRLVKEYIGIEAVETLANSFRFGAQPR